MQLLSVEALIASDVVEEVCRLVVACRAGSGRTMNSWLPHSPFLPSSLQYCVNLPKNTENAWPHSDLQAADCKEVADSDAPDRGALASSASPGRPRG